MLKQMHLKLLPEPLLSLLNKDMKKSTPVRVRIAPSPTGPLHLGTVKTALFNYLFAKQQKGSFVLRIEDTDKLRSKPEFEKDIIDNLSWLGLNWDEGPHYQSQRVEIHQKYIQILLDKKMAFWCYHTPDELEAEKNDEVKAEE